MSVWPGPPDENSWIHACFFTKWLIQIFHWDYGSNWYLSFKYLCFSQVSDMFCCLLYQQLQSVDNIFQSILFKHTKWHFIGTCTNKQSQKHHQIDFKGFFFSLKYFFCQQSNSWLGLRDPGHVVCVWTTRQRKEALYWNQHTSVRISGYPSSGRYKIKCTNCVACLDSLE